MLRVGSNVLPLVRIDCMIVQLFTAVGVTNVTPTVGADGMMLEMHPDPERAWSDGAQSLTFDEYAKMMDELQPYVELWKKERAREQD